MMEAIRALFVALTVIAALAAPAPAQETVKVGVIQPLSGSVAASGNNIRMGAEIGRDKVPVIVGAWGSSMTLAAMPKLEEYGVPMVVETSSAATITKRGNPWV